MELVNEGMPGGNLYVKFDIQFPKLGSEALATMTQALRTNDEECEL
jgi:DnaJ-class molecular chaperone